MNENNLEYLKKTLDGLGFGTKLNDVMETAIRREMPQFSLGITSRHRPLESRDVHAPRTELLNFTLNFNRSKESDMYFLNNYRVVLQKNGDPITRIKTFDLERDYRITALQAYKLLSGLSFEKEVFLRSKAEASQENNTRQEKTPLWFKLQLDIVDAYGTHPLRTFRPEYKYDLLEALAKYPLKGLETPEKLEEAIKTLRNGNYYHAAMVLDKKTVPVSIAANSQMKTIDIYDKDMSEIRDEVIFPERKTAKEAERQQSAPSNRETSVAALQTDQPWVQEPEQETGHKRGR